MRGSPARVFGLCGCLIAALVTLPVHANPFFVRVYGRTYKIDPRYPPEQPQGPKPEEAMRALPSDLAKGPGFRPSHEQVLAEVEERLWIAKSQLEDALDKAASSDDGRSAEDDGKTLKHEIIDSLAAGKMEGRSAELQTLYDRHRALNLLARELRRFLDLPVKTAEAGFSRPKLPPEVEASYRALGFDPLEAYYAFRRVKAAFRSGDPKILAQVAHYPLVVTGKIRRTIHSRDQLIAARETVMDAGVREAVAKSTFETAFARDKGIMLGDGAAWVTRDKTGFGLGAINVP